MLGVIAKLTIKPGTNADFEATMKALQARVQADEPGNKLYALHKTADPNVYVMLERYDDQAALDATVIGEEDADHRMLSRRGRTMCTSKPAPGDVLEEHPLDRVARAELEDLVERGLAEFLRQRRRNSKRPRHPESSSCSLVRPNTLGCPAPCR